MEKGAFAMKRARSLAFIAVWLAGTFALLHGTPTLAMSAETDGPLVPAVAGWPASMASTGDSITRAFNSGSAYTDAPANSWSTGTNASVNSHYSRILAAFPGINGHSFNDAVTGAQMVDLSSQVANVNSQHVEYVTVLLGANDACRPTEAQMTPV